jgi:hypothetical protein
MGGTAVKTLLTVAIAALLAFGLVACGGGDDETTGSTPTSSGTTDGTATAPENEGNGDNEKQAGDDESGASAGDDSGSSQEGSAAFRTPGGDNSIQNYGEEADAEQRQGAEAALATYLDAREAGDWATSCEYLAKAAVEPLEQLAESSPQLKGKGCAAIVGALSAQLPTSSRANPLVEGVASLRFEGERGFALFHGPKSVDYFVPLVDEDGEWKVGALAASQFP